MFNLYSLFHHLQTTHERNDNECYTILEIHKTIWLNISYGMVEHCHIAYMQTKVYEAYVSMVRTSSPPGLISSFALSSSAG